MKKLLLMSLLFLSSFQVIHSSWGEFVVHNIGLMETVYLSGSTLYDSYNQWPSKKRETNRWFKNSLRLKDSICLWSLCCSVLRCKELAAARLKTHKALKISGVKYL